MTTIGATHVGVRPAGTTTRAAADGDGSVQAPSRTAGTITGGIVGAGVATGVHMFTRRSNLAPVRIAGAAASVAAVLGGAYAGNRLLPSAGEPTPAETQRISRARAQDLRIQARVLQATADGTLAADDKERVDELRAEREPLAVAAREPNLVGRALPTAASIAIAGGGMLLAMKYSPDDGKGIAAGFNALMALIIGAPVGYGIGAAARDTWLLGEPHESIPAESQARIDEIDAELDRLLGS